MMNRQWYLYGVVGLLVLVGCVYAFMTYVDFDALTTPVGETHTVVLTEAGYEPETLTIDLYDEVVFKTVRPHAHWPASDVHPTHDQYADFDPRQPVPATESWSFQFTEPGEWHFHDHLNFTYTGIITVVAP